MSNEEYYDYYRFESKDLTTQYESEVGGKRRAVLEKMLNDSGAIAYTSSSSWGGAEYVRELVYPFDTALKNEPYVKLVRTDRFEGEKVVVLEGKCNRKEGNAFNLPVTEANKALKGLPDFKAWVVSKLGVHRTGLGGEHPSGRGTSMVSTDFGMRDGVYLFRIPNDKCQGASEAPTIPKGFEKLTYGQFYDLSQQN